VAKRGIQGPSMLCKYNAFLTFFHYLKGRFDYLDVWVEPAHPNYVIDTFFSVQSSKVNRLSDKNRNPTDIKKILQFDWLSIDCVCPASESTHLASILELEKEVQFLEI
jgi:hypothetical protein